MDRDEVLDSRVPPTLPDIMTIKQAAAFLQVHTQTVHAWATEGSLPAAKLGRDWRFVRDDLPAWVRGNYKAVTPPAPEHETMSRSTAATAAGTSRSPARTKELLAALLVRPTKKCGDQKTAI